MDRQRSFTAINASYHWLMAVVVVVVLSDFHQSARAASIGVVKHEQEELLSSTPYLLSFGYLPKTEPEVLPSMDQITVALRKFQNVAKLNITGEMDTNTTLKMTSPRCGMPDTNIARLPGDPQTFILRKYKWNTRYLKWSIDNGTPDMDDTRVRTSIRKAFKIWENVSGLTFEEVNPSDTDSDIRLSFGSRDHNDGYPFDGPGRTLAHAFDPVDHPTGGDVHFDDDETWTDSEIPTIAERSLMKVAAHELGHALGIDHSEVSGALMYAYYNSHDLQLHTDDIQAIQSLYGAPRTPEPTRSSTRVSSSSKPTRRPFVTHSSTKTTTPLAPTRPLPPLLTRSPSERPPNPCTTVVDTVSVIRGEIFVFKGKWFWRLNSARVITAYPVLIAEFWRALPRDITQVSAVVERPGDGVIVFFIGDRFYELRSNAELIAEFPASGRPISSLFDATNSAAFPRGVDAAFIWGTIEDRGLYITKGHSYYRLSSSNPMKVIMGPENITKRWLVPIPLDAVLTHLNGNSYFFKDGRIYEFNGTTTARGTLVDPKKVWPQCFNNMNDMPTIDDYTSDHQTSGAQNYNILRPIYVSHILLALLFLNVVFDFLS